MADVVMLAKVDSASSRDVQRAVDEIRALRPDVPILRAASPVLLDDRDALRGRRVVVVDDGPTLTHGGMSYGAGGVAAMEAPAAEIIAPRPFAAPKIRAAFLA